MKFRPHRRLLADAMAEAVEVADGAELLAHIRKLFADFGPDFKDDQLRAAAFYGDDDRIGWKNVHIVTIDGYGVVGFTDDPSDWLGKVPE